jgi:hypothetical protein
MADVLHRKAFCHLLDGPLGLKREGAMAAGKDAIPWLWKSRDPAIWRAYGAHAGLDATLRRQYHRPSIIDDR